MAVVADAGPSGRVGSAPSRLGDPIQVGGHGHLEVGRVAGDDMDGDSTGLQERGLIGPGPVGGARDRRSASRSSPRRTPCGVWAAPSSERSTVAPTRSPSTRLIVSATGTTGIAAPCRSAACDDAHRRARPRPAVGRRRGPARRARLRIGRRPAPAPRSRPARSPAAVHRRPTNVDRPARAATTRRSSARRAIGGRHDDDRRRPRAPPRAPSSVCASSGRPAIIAAQLVRAAHPRRGRRRRR